ncbi:MAG: SpoIIE family protein phosphatase [Azonexus sp.]|jgi:PAS domain S-box-containing protein|uniref:SpoIIE family protein phosphatase n=1 Tax=Azonexus sp. TaxID=1872668 RepID=UPI0028364FFB|nr:SpoIIE family protein phosphatase [Azonexus sp.]MDR0775885.1 SpoIIE family protein phosphatase [Azonexus sp.]
MSNHGGKMKILAVDDNRTNLHILQVFLNRLGHQVVLAENGVEAVERFAAEQPDLILLDIMMPIMDGFAAARLIKAMNQERWTPVIFLSALNREENLVEGLDAGADDYLAKPINFIVLEAKLRSMQRSLALQQTSGDALERIRAISNSVLDAIVTLDESGTVIAGNRASERIFGWSTTELVGCNIDLLLPEPQASEHDSFRQRYLGGDNALGANREVVAQRRDGQRFPATLGVTEATLDNQRILVGVIRDISQQKAAEQKLRESARLLQAYYDQTQNEQQLAAQLMEMQLHRTGLKDPRLHCMVIPAASFSGDIIAAARSNHRFYALLADATGHGLTAAISMLPVLALFYRMAKLDFPVRDIIGELNQQLKESMPVGRFVAATLLCLDEERRHGEIWIGGTPEAFLFDRWGRCARSFPSANLPLGILPSDEINCAPVELNWEPESQLILCSDGLLEATDAAGRQFGSAGISAAAANIAPAQRFRQIENALARHLAGALATDDMSLMVIDCL